MSQDVPAKLTRRQSAWLVTSTSLAGTAAVLAFADLFWRYPSAEAPVPLPGMNHLWGQLGWALLLGAVMFLVAWLVRHAIVARLQVAIVISLAVHLVLFFASRHMPLSFRLEQLTPTPELSETKAEELTLPDHGGMESPDTRPEWERPIATPIPEAKRDQPDRRPTEPVLRHPPRPAPEPPSKPIETEVPQKRAPQVIPERTKAEIARQTPQPRPDMSKPVEVPKLDAAKPSSEPELNASKDRLRSSTRPDTSARQPTDARRPDRAVQAARVQANRSEPTPTAAREQVDLKYQAAARAAELTAENIEPAAARDSAIARLQERATEVPRLAKATIPERDRRSNSQVAGSISQPTASTTPQAVARSAAQDMAPSSGGTVSLPRNSMAGSGLSVAATPAEVVQPVTGAGTTARVGLEPSSAASGSRAATSSMPIENGRGISVPGSVRDRGPAGMATAQPGTEGVRAMAVPSNATGAAAPQLGAGPGIASGERAGGGRRLSAVGTEAEGIALPPTGAAGEGGKESGSLVGGPLGTSVARSASGLPGGAGRGISGASSGSGQRGTGHIPGSLGSGLAGRATEPSGRLGASEGPGLGARRGPSGRAAGIAGLSDADLQREQAGALVMAGPQAGASGGAGLSDSSGVSVARRSAGLPGGVGPSRTSGPGGPASGSRLSAVTDGLSTGRDESRGPAVDTDELLSGFLKRSARGHVAEPEGDISPTFSLRKLEMRGRVAESLGGSPASEAAVEAGLEWLARHQHPDGHWSIHDFQTQCKDHACSGAGFFRSDTAATGLTLLAFYGAAYTHQSGRHRETVNRGLRWLVDRQKPDGDLFHEDAEFVWLYSHGMASIALCEAYGMTRDPQLREPAQKSIDFIVAAQHPQYGGWRYRPQFESDTSVSGWQVMALKSAEMAGLTVPSQVYSGVSRWLDSVQGKTIRGAYSYHPSREESLAMTAEGMLMRQYLGTPRNDPILVAGGDYLRTHLPHLAERDAYYWYYATQVMFHLQGDYWTEWNRQLRDLLVSTQVKNGGSAGSWDPQIPAAEKWGAAGGRVYVTCLNILMLEVYYRHLPLYIELEK